MTSDEILTDAEERMEKAVSVLTNNLAGIRTGRANAGLVDSIRVEVYGSFTPLKQLASIGTPEPQQILIRPYDTSTIKEIEKRWLPVCTGSPAVVILKLATLRNPRPAATAGC